MNKRAVLISVLALSSAYAEESAVAETDVGEYGTIIDRQMFGPLPEAFDPAKPPGQGLAGIGGKDEAQLSKEKEEILKNVHFSVINLTPSGESVVGFTDNANQKEPRHYYMKVGEIRDGWTVKAADAAKETMTLVKDGVEVTMKLGDKSGKAAVPTPANASVPASAAAKANDAPASGVSGTGLPLRTRGLSLRARRLEAIKKAEEVRKKAEAAEKAKEDERRKLEEAEREERRKAEQAEREKQIKAEMEARMQEIIKQRIKSAQPAEKSNENNNAQ